MNIKEAKKAVKETVRMYLEKDEFGNYVIPVQAQRPVFLVGAPGIGKTQIMAQIASEIGIGLVSYDMTHMTRQSAVGLPYLADKKYGGKEYKVSEYTMSEIIASVYETIEKSGKKEGILFLDEVNCVSETLAPAMLLFLQYKRFGNQPLPEGWVIVAAGNPPQYNKSVKEFDIATLDRLKPLDVEASFAVWKEYAYGAGVHPAVIAFLELNSGLFYKISSSATAGKQYITARGWEDLSTAIKSYERLGFEVGFPLISQYIVNKDAARKFAVFYDLYNKYASAYQVKEICAGSWEQETLSAAQKAKFDERLSLVSMLIHEIGERAQKDIVEDEVLLATVKVLRRVKRIESLGTDISIQQLVGSEISNISEEMDKAKAAQSLSSEEKRKKDAVIRKLEKYSDLALSAEAGKEFSVIKEAFKKDVAAHENSQKRSSSVLKNIFGFVEDAWGSGSQEMTLFVTELTVNKYTLNFITKWGSDEYFKANGTLKVFDEERKLKEEAESLTKALSTAA